MNVFQLSIYFSFLIYGLLFDFRIIIIYLIIIGIYFILASRIPNGKFNTLRRKIMLALWSDQVEAPIICNWQIDATNLLEFLKTFP